MYGGKRNNFGETQRWYYCQIKCSIIRTLPPLAMSTVHSKDKRKRQKDAEQKNAPDWLTRPVFGCVSTIIARSTFPVNPWPAGDLER
jgi:hypothetical protein